MASIVVRQESIRINSTRTARISRVFLAPLGRDEAGGAGRRGWLRSAAGSCMLEMLFATSSTFIEVPSFVMLWPTDNCSVDASQKHDGLSHRPKNAKRTIIRGPLTNFPYTKTFRRS